MVSSFKKAGYNLFPFIDIISNGHINEKYVVMRHDVDRLPENALITAKIDKDAGVKASYYFRSVKESYDKDIIEQIAEMGHEIGYHYENLSTVCSRNGFRKLKVKSEKIEDDMSSEAIRDFELNLKKLREFYPVKTICMHGSPLSRYDNRLLWEKYDYRDFDIIGEPYFDIDFSEVFYLTDTGRRWDGDSVSVRDKVVKTEVGLRPIGAYAPVGGQRSEVGKQEDGNLAQSRKVAKNRRKNAGNNLRFRSTFDIIEAAENGELPDKIMINVHPQRWNDEFIPWVKELVGQNFKNIVKKWMIKFRHGLHGGC